MENSFEHHDDHDLVVTLDRVLDALTDFGWPARPTG